MDRLLTRASLLLFASGFCALVYQTVWLRELRLVFGASTAATAAVLAIFMAGLGAGGLILGRRADRAGDPIALYARLELGISLAAGLSPFLLAALRRIYVAAGGTAALGLATGTGLRLLMSAAVLGIPAFLMGGTLPALVRAVEGQSDATRRRTGLLYAVNTLGAVAGVVTTTFAALEWLGLRKTLWAASALNLLVAVLAWSLARRSPAAPAAAARDRDADRDAAGPVAFILPAAGIVGFAFLLMELVWYRMLAPILGGSSYTFGLVLAVALAGIGAGSLLYSTRSRRPTLASFAGTCSFQAFCLIVPFALGDRIAIFALFLRSSAVSGFGSLVFAWTLVTVFVVFPAALVAGYQFPLLVALLGRGRRRVARQVGLTYAWNTGGAILGSIAGGFGLLPLLSAPGAWRLVTVVLAGCAVAALVVARSSGQRPSGSPRVLAMAAASLLLCLAAGPTAAWRHSPIGAGRMPTAYDGPNDLRRVLEERRRSIAWEVDGVEASVALHIGGGNTFLINGKADGNARRDAPTQVMLGLVGALLHPEPRSALVIGLGTGSSGGWLASVPTLERVTVVEIEPAVERVARDCGSVNREAMSNPRMELVVGDGRELLRTTRQRYDVIASEPSNPYRAAIASLYSRDFYAAAAGRLEERGLFLQWLQGYEVDAQLVRTVYATLRAVFPYVESWQVGRTDLLLVASRTAIEHDVERLRARASEAPYAQALAYTWGVAGAEGFYSAFLASSSFADALSAAEDGWINTDDHPVLEFGFARNLGREGLFYLGELHALAQRRGQDRPEISNGELDWSKVRELRAARAIALDHTLTAAITGDLPPGDRELELRVQARAAYLNDQPDACRDLWFRQPQEPEAPIDVAMVAEVLASGGDDRAPVYAERLRAWQPVASDAILARWHATRGRKVEAVRYLVAAFEGYRSDPWPPERLMRRTLILAHGIAVSDPALGRLLDDALAQPFTLQLFHETRRRLRVEIAKAVSFEELCAAAISPFEPHVPWERQFLVDRFECYRRTGHPGTRRARKDLEAFLAAAPPRLDQTL